MYENWERNNQLSANKTSKGLKSAPIFELIHNYLIKEGANAVKTCQATYNFEILKKKKGKIARVWGIDLKNGNGGVSLKPFGNPDATFRMTDADFHKVCMRELNPQIAFLQGKMKIKGNMKKATLFTPELFPKPTPENFEAYRGANL